LSRFLLLWTVGGARVVSTRRKPLSPLLKTKLARLYSGVTYFAYAGSSKGMEGFGVLAFIKLQPLPW
jgi:hypothetical protein